MNKKLTAPFMGSTDVDKNDDFASETVGVDREQGLWVINADGSQVRFSLEVQQQILDGIGDYLESIS